MTTKPKTRKAPAAAIDPVFAAIAEHKALIREHTRCQNIFQTARAKAEKKHGIQHGVHARNKLGRDQFMERLTAASADSRLEYDRWCRATDAAYKAAMRVARTTPTSPAGAAALITHTRSEIEPTDDWQEDWVPVALKTVAGALSRMGRETA
jgi:hypothetical protein